MSGGEKISITYIAQEFPKITETFVYREISGLLDRGHNVRVIAMHRPRQEAQIEGLDRLISIATYIPDDFSAGFFRAQLKWFLRKPLTYLKEIYLAAFKDRPKTNIGFKGRVGQVMRGAAIATELRKTGAEKVHVPGTGHEIIAAHAACALAGVPYGFTLHAPFALYAESRLLAIHARDAEWIASISNDAKERIVALAGESVRPKIRIVRCGVDISEFAPSPIATENRIAAVGSLIDFKGHDVLIRAARLLVDSGLNVKVDIVGPGPEKNNLEKLIAELNLSDAVTLHGAKKPSECREILGGCSAFALASRIGANGARDGIPVAIMEAMAMGLPCVSTKISGIPELIEDGVGGILVDPDDPAALAEALGKIFVDRNFAQRLGEEARKKILAEFSLDTQIESVIKIFFA